MGDCIYLLSETNNHKPFRVFCVFRSSHFLCLWIVQVMNSQRKNHEAPLAIREWGWRFHHLGIPTNEEKPNEVHLEKFKLSVSGFETSPFGIEWMRYEPGCTIPDLIQRVPHIAFEVDNLEEALSKDSFVILTEPNSPSPGVRVAMIEHDGAPIELIDFSRHQE